MLRGLPRSRCIFCSNLFCRVGMGFSAVCRVPLACRLAWWYIFLWPGSLLPNGRGFGCYHGPLLGLLPLFGMGGSFPSLFDRVRDEAGLVGGNSTGGWERVGSGEVYGWVLHPAGWLRGWDCCVTVGELRLTGCLRFLRTVGWLC